MLSTPGEVDTARAQFDEEEHVDCFQPQRFNREKITGQHLALVMAQERAPSAFRSPLRCGEQVVTFEEITDGRAVDKIAKFDQFAFNTVIVPARVLTSQLKDKGFEFRSDPRTTCSSFSLECPFAPNQFTMPTKDSIWSEDQHGLDLNVEVARCPP